MPSSIGHALGGLIAGWVITRRARSAGREAGPGSSAQAFTFATLAVAPDLDLLFGTHSTYTHSIGAVAIAAVAALALTRGRDTRFALACAGAWGSHLLLDWLGADNTPPLGIMALWPFTSEFYQAPVAVFMAISRRYWLPEFYAYNAKAVLREVVILSPLAWLAWLARNPRTPDTGQAYS